MERHPSIFYEYRSDSHSKENTDHNNPIPHHKTQNTHSTHHEQQQIITTTNNTTQYNYTTARMNEMRALRSYVTAQAGPYGLHPDTILVDLTHSNLQQKHIEIRLSKHCSIQKLYELLHQKTGSAIDDQILQLYNNNTDECVVMELPAYDSPDAARPIAYYGGMDCGNSLRVHCMDTNPFAISARGALENVALVEKYRMSDEEYASRKGTVRSWAREQQERDPTFSLQAHAAKHQAMQHAQRQWKRGLPLPEGFVVENGAVVAVSVVVVSGENVTEDCGETSVAHCTVGDRCEIQPGGRRGRVAWVGSILPDLEYWVGVILDEPVGQNDGTFKATGERYFEAPPRYGAYCRGKNVETGDFPERDLFDDDSDSEDEL
jgi:tubulin-folding cofactor B